MKTGRPKQQLTEAEARALNAAQAKVERAEAKLDEARAELIQMVARTGKPSAAARLLGVDSATISYWLGKYGH